MGRLIKPLKDFLDSKPLYYDDIDYEYFPDLWSRIKNNFNISAKVVHVIGTNGKGSTSATLHKCLSNSNITVGSYNSPELFSYRDMYTINGAILNKLDLKIAHEFLQKIIQYKDMQKISRFEYTTLLAFKVFQNCEFMILEAGLGGEYDATNVLKKELSIITPIDIDHVKFLGNTVEDIAKTKLRSVKNKLVSAKQMHTVAEEIVGDYKKKYNKVETILTEKETSCIKQFGLTTKAPKFIRNNVELGVLAFKNLGFKFNKNTLKGLTFEGRFQQVRNNIILDVGHNPMAARKIFENISNNTTLIYNSYTDKDYLEVIEILLPKLKKIILIDVLDRRVCKTKFLLKKLKSSPVNVSTMRNDFRILSDENYLVFGSFSVVKEFTIRFLQNKI